MYISRHCHSWLHTKANKSKKKKYEKISIKFSNVTKDITEREKRVPIHFMEMEAFDLNKENEKKTQAALVKIFISLMNVCHVCQNENNLKNWILKQLKLLFKHEKVLYL